MTSKRTIPCKICIYRIKEDENSVWCNHLQITSFREGSKLKKDGLEIVPKAIFDDEDVTCAAQHIIYQHQHNEETIL